MTAREIASGIRRMHLLTVALAAKAGKDGDLREACDLAEDAIESALLAAERRGFEEARAELGYGRDAPKPSSEQEAWIIDHRASISDTPALMSLLYDLDRLPEQVVSARAASELILIVAHFQAFKDSLLPDEDRQAEIAAAERRGIERAAEVANQFKRDLAEGIGEASYAAQDIASAILALVPEGDVS